MSTNELVADELTLTPADPSTTLRAVLTPALRFDLLMAVLLTVLVATFFSDLWAHSHGQVESFFTPWHLALYSAAGAVFLVLGVTWSRAVRAGASRRAALPDGYGLSFIGAMLFLIGGGLDLFWHRAFGIEANVSALFSPTHILLFASGVLMTTGPLRAAWRRSRPRHASWIERLPMVISLALVLSVLTAMTQFINPLVDAYAETPVGPPVAYSDLYTMAADGSRQTRVVISDQAHSFAPVWSADGTKIAYSTGADRVFRVMLANADGNGSRPLFANSPEGSMWPGSWSPDGAHLLITAQRTAGRSTIDLVDVRSGQRIALTSGMSDEVRPVFSPDGSKIVFASNRDGRFQIYLMNGDGTGVKQLTHADRQSWAAAWAPDGQTIAFNSDRTGHYELYTMKADGRDQRQVTRASNGASWEPTWSPDGQRIAFAAERDGRRDIYLINPDGTGETNLTRTVGLDEGSPTWSKDGLILYQAGQKLPFNAVPEVRERLGLASILVQSALIAGLLLMALRRGGLPMGALTLIFGMNAALMSVLSDEYRFIPGAIIAGSAGDLLLRWLRPSDARVRQVRAVACLVPAIYFAAYLITVALGRGVAWSVHLWAGSVVLAGCVGLLLSFALDAPARSGTPLASEAS